MLPTPTHKDTVADLHLIRHVQELLELTANDGLHVQISS